VVKYRFETLNKNGRNKLKKSNRTIAIVLTGIAFVLLFLFISDLLNVAASKETIEYYQLLDLIEKGDVTEVRVSGAYKLTFKKGDEERIIYAPSRTAFNTDVAQIAARIRDRGDGGKLALTVEYDNPDSGSIFNMLFTIGIVVVMVLVIYFLYKQMNGANKQTLNFGKTKSKASANVKIKFSDVAGAEEEKEELKEIVEFLKTPKKFSALGARIPKGVLLIGPPGTGKTLFAKAVAGEANVPFFSCSGSDFVEMFVGVGASRVRDLFDQAKRNMPCIVFIDEIDAVGRQRGAGMGGGHDEREQTLNQLLVQMDGFETNEGIIVMAATNRSDVLDPALTRAGRFDRQIYVPIPDVRGREAIFRVHVRNKPMADDVNYQTLARITSGFSGAEIENLLNEAAILAARSNRTQINMQDINEGINKVVIGPQKRSRIISENDKRITAIHESGHAILTKLLPNSGETVHEVSIIPRGKAAGYTMSRPINDETHMSKSKLLDNIVVMLGGRAAEEIMIKDICTGAENDIQRVTSIAHSMVAEWGMSDDIGTVYLGSDKDVFLGRDFQAQHKYSEVMAAKIDAEAKKIIDASYARALELLTKNKKIIENMAQVLLERETIYTDVVDMLLQNKSVAEVLVYVEQNDRLAAAAAEAQAQAAAQAAAIVKDGEKLNQNPDAKTGGKPDKI
jgi:cell division protease FtsH